MVFGPEFMLPRADYALDRIEDSSVWFGYFLIAVALSCMSYIFWIVLAVRTGDPSIFIKLFPMGDIKPSSEFLTSFKLVFLAPNLFLRKMVIGGTSLLDGPSWYCWWASPTLS